MKSLNRIACTAAVAAVMCAGGTARASDADDRIEESFEKTYVYRTYLKADSINADAKDGVVTLTGTVAEESHKALAQDTATSLPGVKSVNNLLATKAEVATENKDAWIARKISLALLFHRNVNSGNTDVTSLNGVVTLKGEAASEAQRDLTAEYARDIEGVVEVKNEMTIAAAPAVAHRTEGEKLDDASITAQVRSALKTHRSTSAMTTKVETRDGVVTLTGIAANEAEKALVTKLVNDIKGVSSVKNEMTIAVARNT